MMLRFLVWLARALLLLLALMFAFVLAFAAVTTWLLLSGTIVAGQPMYGGDPAPLLGDALAEAAVSIVVIVATMGARRWLQMYLQRRNPAGAA